MKYDWQTPSPSSFVGSSSRPRRSLTARLDRPLEGEGWARVRPATGRRSGGGGRLRKMAGCWGSQRVLPATVDCLETEGRDIESIDLLRNCGLTTRIESHDVDDVGVKDEQSQAADATRLVCRKPGRCCKDALAWASCTKCLGLHRLHRVKLPQPGSVIVGLSRVTGEF